MSGAQGGTGVVGGGRQSDQGERQGRAEAVSRAHPDDPAWQGLRKAGGGRAPERGHLALIEDVGWSLLGLGSRQ